MTLDQYEKLSGPFRVPARRKALIATDKILTGAVYAVFCLLCLSLLLRSDSRLLPLLVVCGVPFVLLSLIRARINAPRPYEIWNIEPLIPKETRGRSFPSRHGFSAFLIAAAIRPLSPGLSSMIAGIGVLLSIVRVIGGVHFLKDVIAGAGIGIACGWIGSCLLL